MEIRFAAGAAGFDEARAVLAIARAAIAADLSQSHEIQVLDTVKGAAESQLARPEFADLRARAEARIDSTDTSAGGGFWRSLFGPSRREVLLSEQRIAALDRAARAESSSFEALAETARVARERDAARARIAELELELQTLRHREAE